MFGDLFSPLDQGDARRGRGCAFGQDLLSQQSVDQCALAGIELANYHNQEKFIQLQDGFLQAVQSLARQIELGQGELEPGQGFFFVTQEMGLLIGEYRLVNGLLLVSSGRLDLPALRCAAPIPSRSESNVAAH